MDGEGEGEDRVYLNGSLQNDIVFLSDISPDDKYIWSPGEDYYNADFLARDMPEDQFDDPKIEFEGWGLSELQSIINGSRYDASPVT